MSKKFVVSTADVYAYDQNEQLLFRGITLIDSSIETKINPVEVRGGKSNPLQFIYYTNPEMSVKISDCQWSLDYLASMTGSSVTTGNSVYVEESVLLTVTTGAGTVTGTPLVQPGDSVIYGWVTDSAGTVATVQFTGQNFTYGTTAQTVCVRYYATNSASRSVTINSKYLPKTVKLVMSAIIASPDVSSTVLGELQVIIPKFSLSGNFMINLKADAVSSSPIDGKALAYRDPAGSGGCTESDYFAKVIEIITNANWYDDVVALSFIGDNVRALTHPTTLQTSLRAITSQGYVFTPISSGITYASSVTGSATIDSSGLITTGATPGATTISATITAKNTVGTAFVLNVS